MPEAVLRWGLALIEAIQRIHGPALDAVFRGVSFLGEELFYLLVFPLILWCLDFGLGARLGVVFLLSTYLNVDLKDLWRQPRPFDLNPAVKLAEVSGYGLPSGHAQSAMVAWGYLASRVRRKPLWLAAVALILAIGFSRIYLGLHFPTDVLAGWLIGFLVLWVFLAWAPGLGRLLARLSPPAQAALVVLAAVLLVMIHPTNDTAAAVGTLAGLGIGLLPAGGLRRFSAAGPWRQRAARFALGAVVVLLLYLGLKAVFPGEGAPFYLVFRFVRYAAIGFWAAFGAPWVFQRLRLAPVYFTP